MKSFLSGRRDAGGATPGEGPAKSPADFTPLASRSGHCTKPPADGAQPPRVECVKQGGKVVRLIVHCTCGERTEIECIYPGGG